MQGLEHCLGCSDGIHYLLSTDQQGLHVVLTNHNQWSDFGWQKKYRRLFLPINLKGREGVLNLKILWLTTGFLGTQEPFHNTRILPILQLLSNLALKVNDC